MEDQYTWLWNILSTHSNQDSVALMQDKHIDQENKLKVIKREVHGELILTKLEDNSGNLYKFSEHSLTIGSILSTNGVGTVGYQHELKP